MAMSEGLDVMPTYSLNKGSGDMFGGSGSWIFFLFFLLAWGGNGLGGFGGNNATNQITNDFLFSNLNNQIGRLSDQTAAGFTGVNQGLCSLGYETAAGFTGVNQGLCSLGYETASNFKDMQAQMASCCCETNRNIDAVRYENAKNTCDIITAGDKNTDRIINYLTQNEIQTLRDQLQSANLALSNAAQTTNIVNSIRPIPQPAYITCSPYAAMNGGCGC